MSSISKDSDKNMLCKSYMPLDKGIDSNDMSNGSSMQIESGLNSFLVSNNMFNVLNGSGDGSNNVCETHRDSSVLEKKLLLI